MSRPASTDPHPRRALRRALATSALTAVFLVSFLVGVWVHRNVPSLRGTVASLVTSAVSGAVRGSLVVGSIDEIGPSGLRASDVRVVDPEQREVLHVGELRAVVQWTTLVSRLVRGPGVQLTVDEVHLGEVRGHLLPEQSSVGDTPDANVPSIAATFLPAEPSPPGGEPTVVALSFPSVTIARLSVWSELDAVPRGFAEFRELGANVSVTNDVVDVQLTHIDADADGVLPARLTLNGQGRVLVPGGVTVDADASVQGASAHVSGGLVGDFDTIDARVTAAQLEPSMKTWLDAWPMLVPVTGTAEGRGSLTGVRVKGDFTAEESRFGLQGTLRLLPTFGITLDVDGKGANLEHVAERIPKTSLDFRGNVDARLDGGPHVEASVTVEPTQVEGVPIPPLSGSVTVSPEGALQGKARIGGGTEPMDVAFERSDAGAWSLQADSGGFEMSRIVQLDGKVRGRVAFSAKAKITGDELVGNVTARSNGLRVGDAAIASASARARLEGSLKEIDSAHLDASVEGTGLSAGGRRVDRFRATAVGPLKRPKVAVQVEEGARELDVETTVDTTAPGQLAHVDAVLRAGGVEVSASIDGLVVEEQSVRLRNARIRGLGKDVTASGRVAPGAFEVQLDAEEIQLKRLVRILGLPGGVLEGTATVSLSVRSQGDTAEGEIRASVKDGVIYGLRGLSGAVNSQLHEGNWTGALQAKLEGYTDCDAIWRGPLRGSPIDAATWRGIAGTSSLRCSVLLNELAPLIALVSPVKDVTGTVDVKADVSRAEGEQLPSATLSMQTRDLALSGTWRSHPIEWPYLVVALGATFDAATGSARSKVRLTDGLGDVVTLETSTELTPRELLESEGRLIPKLGQAPLKANVALAERAFESWPAFLRPPGIDGTVGATLDVTGSLASPRAVLHAKGLDLHRPPPSGEPRADGLDVATTATYDAKSRSLEGSATVHVNGKRVGRLRSTTRLAHPLAGYPDLTGGAPATVTTDCRGRAVPTAEATRTYHCKTEVELDGFPLTALAQVPEGRFGGHVAGKASIQRRGDAETVEAKFSLEDMRVGEDRLGSGRLAVTANAREASFRALLGSKKRGALLTGDTGITWLRGAPRLSKTRPLRAHLRARNFSLAAVAPLLRESFSRFEGRLNADVEASLTPRSSSKPGVPRVTAKGSIEVDRGHWKIAKGGIEMERLQLSAKLAPKDRATELTLDGEASVGSNAKNLKLGGRLTLDDAAKGTGRGAVRVNFVEVPVRQEGIVVAHATGAARLSVKSADGKPHLAVSLPKLRILLPKKSRTDLLPTEGPRNVRVVELSEPPSEKNGSVRFPWNLRVDFGKDVRLDAADRVSLPFDGTLTMSATDPMRGRIRLLPSGHLQLLGKTFFVDSGGVTFDQPQIGAAGVNLRARWQANDGTIVFVEVVGRLNALEEPRLFSEPPRPKDELWALLLGTTSDDSFVASGATGGSAGGATALALNQVLADTPLSGVQVASGSTRRGEVVNTASYRVSDTVTIDYKGVEANERSVVEGDLQSSGVVDWRFHPDWALRGELGQAFGLELRWRYRY